jgi:hypothetical protein
MHPVAGDGVAADAEDRAAVSGWRFAAADPPRRDINHQQEGDKEHEAD